MGTDSSLKRNFFACWIFFAVLAIATAANDDDDDYGGIHVKCTANYMQLTLERVHYKKIDPETLHLTDKRCKVFFYNETIMIIRAPLGSCGTLSAQRGKLLAFRNEVYADLTGSSSIAREPAYQFRLQCLYYTTVKISLHSFRPEPKGPIVINTTPGIGTFEFETSMFQTDKYISKYTQFPVKVHIGENIFLQVKVKSNLTGLSLLLENCRATTTSNPNDTTFYTLIKDGCPVSEFLNYKSSYSPYQQFSFKSFRINDAEVMYLHCDVFVCANNTNSSRCSQGCIRDAGSSRRRRDNLNQTGEVRGLASLKGAVKVLMDRVQPDEPKEAGSRSHAPVVTFEKLLILMTITLAGFLAITDQSQAGIKNT